MTSAREARQALEPQATGGIHRLLRIFQVRDGLGLLDLTLLVTAILMFATPYTVLLFHLVFVLLTLGAFSWKFRAFSVRASGWVTATTIQVLHAIHTGKTQPDELIEIPLLTTILVLVFLIASRREKARQQLEDQSLLKSLLASLEESEQRYRSLFEHNPDAVFSFDISGRFLSANLSTERLSGYAARELLQRSLMSLMAAEDVARAWEHFQRAAKGEPQNYETTLTRKDGDRVYVHVTNLPIVVDGQIAGVFGIAKDISQRKRGESSLRESKQRLEETLRELQATQAQVIQQERLRALGTMASGVAHDFNNALTPILGYSNLFLSRPGDLDDRKRVARSFELIHTAAQDAASVVKRLREFYRDRDALEPPAAVDVNRVVSEVVSLTQPKWKDQAQALGRTISIDTDLRPLPPLAGTDSEMREVLTNLIFNAVDAMPDGGLLTIRTYPDGDEGVIEVRDTGTGMTDAVRQRCLEPFFTTKGAQGTGLGLSMVHGIIRRQNGSIGVESVMGRGTTVRLRLPARIMASAPVTFPSELAELGLHPLRVLVVDDEPTVRELVSDYLVGDGHTVTTAANGREALERFRAKAFDLVLTDRAMPEMSGDQLAAAVKDLSPATPVVLLTGFGDLMRVAGERPAGVDLVVSKPVGLPEVRRALAYVTKGQAAKVPLAVA